MTLHSQDVQRMLDMLRSAMSVHCVCHRGPDGDAVGALLGMGLLLERVFPEKHISCHCSDSLPEAFHFLPKALSVQNVPASREGSLFIFLDCAEPKLTEMQDRCPFLFDGSMPTITIDHHSSNSMYARLNIVVPEASSTCEIIVHIAHMLSWTLDADIATCLLTGIYTDTGGMLHGNTSASVYRSAAHLLRVGARHQHIVQRVFRTARLSTLKLWGRVLENIAITEESGAISAVRHEDFRAAGASYSELSDAIDYVNAVPGMRFSLVLSERAGLVKGSLRTLCDDVDVSEMAGKFGGGGHKKAAGFSVPGRLKSEVRWKIVEEEGHGGAGDIGGAGGLIRA